MDHIIKIKIGAKVIHANNPKEGFEILKKFVPDLLLLDMEMPMMDGVTTLKYIRSINKLLNLPVIACTSINKSNLVVALKKLGIIDFIHKKTEPSIITHRLKIHLAEINLQRLHNL